MNIYEITYKEKDWVSTEKEMVVSHSTTSAIDLINSERRDRLGFDPIIVETKLIQEDALVSK